MANTEVATKIYQLKISLNEITPAIWRRFQVPGDYSLEDLHLIIQRVLGWDNDHLYCFTVRRNTYTDPGIANPEYGDGDASSITVGEAFSRKGSKNKYLYDFGDCWKHTILLEKTLAPIPGEQYPLCVTGERSCPPEDCGGSYRYDWILQVLSDPEDEEYEQTKEWMGDGFDSEAFDPEKVNTRLARQIVIQINDNAESR